MKVPGKLPSAFLAAGGPNNSSITLATVIDEIDWVIGGYGDPTPGFLFSLNSLVDAYVLTDAICLPWHDAAHLNLAQPVFPNGRPLLEMLLSDRVLEAIVEGQEHLQGDRGRLLYVFSGPLSCGKKGYLSWFPKYSKDVDRGKLMDIIPNDSSQSFPNSTPLLVYVCGGRDGTNQGVGLFRRDVAKCLRSVIAVSMCSRLHPVLPAYAGKVQLELMPPAPHSIVLYKKLAGIHNVKVSRLLSHVGYREIALPPLSSLLLSRCKLRDDIPEQLRRLRGEFQGLREMGRIHEMRLEKAGSLGEQLDAIEEFDEFWKVFAKKTRHRSTRLIYRIWDFVKEASPVRGIVKAVDRLIGWDEKRLILNRYKGLVDVWKLTRNLPPVTQQLQNVDRLFGKPISGEAWANYVRNANEINSLAFPKGRG